LKRTWRKVEENLLLLITYPNLRPTSALFERPFLSKNCLQLTFPTHFGPTSSASSCLSASVWWPLHTRASSPKVQCPLELLCGLLGETKVREAPSRSKQATVGRQFGLNPIWPKQNGRSSRLFAKFAALSLPKVQRPFGAPRVCLPLRYM